MSAATRLTTLTLGTAFLLTLLSARARAAVSVSESTTLFAGNIEQVPGATLMKWDQGLNTDTTPDNSSGGTWPGVLEASPYYGESDGMGGFNYLDKGVFLEDASGAIEISDLTSAQITEDIRLDPGFALSINFVQPSDANTPIGVAAVGLRMGGNANPLSFSFYDVNNNLINSLSVAGGLKRDPAFIASDNGNPVAAIHRIDVTQTGGGFYVLGTLNDTNTKIDLSYSLTLGLPGDFNGDHVVDAADYVVWRKGFGPTYTQDDYNTWRSHFGQSGSGGASLVADSAVPEPATWWLLSISGCLMSAVRIRRRVFCGLNC